MSEADSPNDQPDSASINPTEQPPAVCAADADVVESIEDDGWQTVDFPGAMSIDALPHSQALPPNPVGTVSATIGSGVIHYSSAELDPATAHLTLVPSESPDAATQLQNLKQENAALRDRLTQAELDLVQHQIEWQLETACSQAEAITGGTIEPIADMQPLPIERSHERLHQLLQELERSQQTAQRQQILVETLTEQLESSQERIAQLERDCALIQQRHNEQVQQVLQAESTCRDLRLRLHRQQQQTLQFKAALEKCLEMPMIYSHQAFSEADLDDGTALPHPLAALLKPQNQPVKPWSQPSETDDGFDEPVLPKTLFNLLNHDLGEQDYADVPSESDDPMGSFNPPFHRDQESTIAGFTEPSALLDSNDPQFVAHLMQLMFPENVEGQPYSGAAALEADVSQAESVFDLSPFLGAEQPLTTLPSVEDAQQADASPERFFDEQLTLPSEEAAIVPAVSPDAPSADLLWHDLAILIDPVAIEPSANEVPAIEEARTPASTPVPASRGGIPPLSVAPHPILPPTTPPASASAPVAAPSDPSVQSPNTWTWRDRLSSPKKVSLVPMAEQASPDKPGTDKTEVEETATEDIVIERAAQRPSKLLALSTIDRRSEVKQTVSAASQTKPASASFATATLSPIVYPLRSSKKLASLAAVDLPTFPKR